MLHSLFPKAHRKFLSLPLLGPIADGFDDWLAAHGYTRDSRGYLIRMLKHVDADLRLRQVKDVGSLTHLILHDCWRTLIKTYPSFAGTVRTLERYLAATNRIASARPETASSTASILLEEYANYLQEVRGLTSDTIARRRHTAHLNKEGITLKTIHRSHLESYITRTGKRLGRRSLQHEVSALRVFLRFLAMDGRVPAGLDSQIDTPRLYRLEQLPRALPWETVSALLRSIDRTSAMGCATTRCFC